MPPDTPFHDLQKQNEKIFARMGARAVDNLHGATSLTMTATWPDGKVARLTAEWVTLPHNPALSGGDDGG